MSPSPSVSSRPSSPSVFFGRIALFSSASFSALPSRVDGDQRQAMAVGGDQAHRVGPQHEQRAVQEIPRVFAGDRKLRLRDHLLDGAARQRRARRAAGFGQRRKILARQRLHPRVEPIGGDLHAALVFGDADVGVGQRLDDLVELLRRQRQRSGLRRPSPRTCCAGRLRDRWQESGPRRLSLPSARSRESESCSCARRFPGKVAVLAEGRSCGRQVPWLC